MHRAPRFIAYRRVSTKEQGKSGLGLEAQRHTIEAFVKDSGGELIADFVEVETGKGSDALDRRPELQRAMREAKKRKATLVVSKLDRLSRNVHFISGLMEAKVDFRCCDFPTREPAMLHIYAAMAEDELRRISRRIREALDAKKKRGEPVGNPGTLQPVNRARATAADAFARRLLPTLRAYRAAKLSQRQMVDALNEAGTKTAQGCRWSLMQVQRVLARAGL